MNQATADMIEFLNRPELDFSFDPTEADTTLEPNALRERVSAILVQPPITIAEQDAERVRAAIDQADWKQVSDEFSRRLEVTDDFFGGDDAQVPAARVV